MQTETQMRLIAKEAAEESLKHYTANLREVLKPMMFEVAEKVSVTAESKFRELFANILGINLENTSDVREFQQDLFWARKARLNQESDQRLIRNTVLRSIVTGFLGGLGTTAVVLLTLWQAGHLG